MDKTGRGYIIGVHSWRGLGIGVRTFASDSRTLVV